MGSIPTGGFHDMSKIFCRRLKYVYTEEERWITSRSSSSRTTRHRFKTGKCNSFPQSSGSGCAWVVDCAASPRTHWDLSTGPSACGAGVMPLHHVPSNYKDEDRCCIRIAALKRRMHHPFHQGRSFVVFAKSDVQIGEDHQLRRSSVCWRNPQSKAVILVFSCLKQVA